MAWLQISLSQQNRLCCRMGLVDRRKAASDGCSRLKCVEVLEAYSEGQVNQKIVSWSGWLSNPIEPPIDSIKVREILSPNPVPPR